MLTVLERTPDFSVGVFENVSMTIWYRAVTVQSVVVSNRATLLAAKHGAPLLMSVVQQLSTPPSEQVRRVMQESLTLTRQTKPLGVAVAIEAHGMLAAAARSVVSGLFLAARGNHPSRCFGRAEDVALWFSTLRGTGGAPFADLMIQQLNLLRGPASTRMAL